MASYHYRNKFVSRGAKQNLAAKLAYNNGAKLTSDDDLCEKNFSHKAGVLYSGFVLPKGAPDFCRDLQKFAAAIEKAEPRKDGILARSLDIALPHELVALGPDGKADVKKLVWLMDDFARETWARKGYPVQYAIHAPDKDGDKRNFHAHVIVALRKIENGQFAKRKLTFNKKQLVALDKYERAKFANMQNHALERWGQSGRVDHRSLFEQIHPLEGRPRIAPKRIPRIEFVVLRREKKTARPQRSTAATTRRLMQRARIINAEPAPNRFQNLAADCPLEVLIWREYQAYKIAGLLHVWRDRWRFYLKPMEV